MLRISRIDTPDGVVTLRLEGRVQGPWREALRQLCAQILVAKQHLVLDLTDVSFIDLQGVALCHDLRDHNVALLHDSLFMAERLKG